MNLTYMPLLQLQRDLFDQPRGTERFKSYIDKLTDDAGEMELPLSAFNPMGKDHIPALLDTYLTFELDRLVPEWLAEAEADLVEVDGDFKVTLVIADDQHGQWTNRYATEFGHRFESRPMYRRGWLIGMLWTSETPVLQAVKDELLTAVFRGVEITRHGIPETLEGMLAQEGRAMRAAGCESPMLSEDEFEYTRDVIRPHLGSYAYPTQFAAIFGDEAAESLGYEPLGLSPRAGLAMARQGFPA